MPPCFSRDFRVQRGTAPGDSGKAALFRWGSAAEPGGVARNGRDPAPLRARPTRPLGTTRDPVSLRGLGTRPPGGRGASVRPPRERPRCAPFAKIPDEVVGVVRTWVKGWGGGKGEGKKGKGSRTGAARSGPDSLRESDPAGVCRGPVDRSSKESSLDPARPCRACGPDPAAPPGERPSSPRSVGALPYFKELVAPSAHEGPDGDVRRHFLDGREEAHPIQVEFPLPAIRIASSGCSRDAAPDFWGQIGTFRDTSRNISIESGEAPEPRKRSFCLFGAV
jgi:hypothetical protein